MKITVTSLKRVNQVTDAMRLSGELPYVISLLTPMVNHDESFPSLPSAEATLQLEMDDVRLDSEAPHAPAAKHAIEIVNFVLEARARGGNLCHLVLHCMQGVSRSTAAAIVALYVDERLKHYRGDDELLSRLTPRVRLIRENRLEDVGRFAPNLMLLSHLDQHLETAGLLTNLGASLTMVYR